MAGVGAGSRRYGLLSRTLRVVVYETCVMNRGQHARRLHIMSMISSNDIRALDAKRSSLFPSDDFASLQHHCPSPAPYPRRRLPRRRQQIHDAALCRAVATITWRCIAQRRKGRLTGCRRRQERQGFPGRWTDLATSVRYQLAESSVWAQLGKRTESTDKDETCVASSCARRTRQSPL